jgi:uncharacterized protein (DUF2147 family)
VKLAFLAAMAFSGASLAQAAGLGGVWQSVGDRNGEPESLIRITESDGAFEGTVIAVFSPPASGPNPRCDLCPGELKGKPVVGMQILRGQRGEGEILDPDEGRVYRCILTLLEGGAKLEVRGYVGISLFGRSQVWLRVR